MDFADETEPSQPSPSGKGTSSGKGTPSRPPLLTVAALAIALIATGLAVLGWFRPSTGAPSFTDQQSTDAKASICETFATVSNAVVTNTHMANPVEGDPAGALAVAANARLALFGGGAYLRDRLALQPATPADLTKAVNAAASTLQELGMGYLAGLNSSQQPLRDSLNSEIQDVGGLCQ